MSDLEELRKAIVEFTQERDWDQFHNGKDLALALSIEASELNEAFLWKEAKDVNVDKVKEELADIVNYAILIADKYNLDIKQIVLEKLRRNAEKYPVEKAYGSAKKYNELCLSIEPPRSNLLQMCLITQLLITSTRRFTSTLAGIHRPTRCVRGRTQCSICREL